MACPNSMAESIVAVKAAHNGVSKLRESYDLENGARELSAMEIGTLNAYNALVTRARQLFPENERVLEAIEA